MLVDLVKQAEATEQVQAAGRKTSNTLTPICAQRPFGDDFRSVVATRQHASIGCLPELAAASSLGQKIEEATVANLLPRTQFIIRRHDLPTLRSIKS